MCANHVSCCVPDKVRRAAAVAVLSLQPARCDVLHPSFISKLRLYVYLEFSDDNMACKMNHAIGMYTPKYWLLAILLDLETSGYLGPYGWNAGTGHVSHMQEEAAQEGLQRHC